MDPTRNGPIALAESRLRWADRRQQVLAQNIANADTPGFRPADLRPFPQTLARASTGLARTDPRHLLPARGGDGQAVQDRRAAERTPNGNAVGSTSRR